MMTSGRLLARNTFLNLVGHGAPALVALVAFPLLIQGLGTARFGVLTLAWMAIGYFGLFDLGLGRALTQLVAERLGSGCEEDLPSPVWTALLLMALLGIVGGAVLALFAPWLVQRVFSIPSELRSESIQVIRLLAFSLPWVISTAGLRGVLEAMQRFDMVNAVRLPMGVFTFLGPLLVLPFSSSLVAVVAVLLAGRVVAWLAHLLLCLRALPALCTRTRVQWKGVTPLLRLGGWMTVSNVVSPLMVYFDRFLIAMLLSLTAVAYYVTPYEAVVKLWLIPGALLGVFFPAFVASFVQDRRRMTVLFDQAVRAIFVVLFPVTLVLVTFAPEGLNLWLGDEFARNSTRVLRWLAVGVFINSVGQVPFVALQGAGRPDITGKLHLLELPFYFAALWWMTGRSGIEGAAIVWVGRVVLDAAVLFTTANRLFASGDSVLRRAGLLMAPGLFFLVLATLPEGFVPKAAFLLAVLAAFSLAVWHHILDPAERTLLREWFGSRREAITSA